MSNRYSVVSSIEAWSRPNLPAVWDDLLTCCPHWAGFSPPLPTSWADSTAGWADLPPLWANLPGGRGDWPAGWLDLSAFRLDWPTCCPDLSAKWACRTRRVAPSRRRVSSLQRRVVAFSRRDRVRPFHAHHGESNDSRPVRPRQHGFVPHPRGQLQPRLCHQPRRDGGCRGLSAEP